MDLPEQPPVPYSVEVLHNPSQGQLRRMAVEDTPCCSETGLGNIDKVSRNKARMAKYTYVIDPQGDPDAYSHRTIDPGKAQSLIERQTEYIQRRGKLIAVEGYVGLGPKAVPVQWLYTPEGANIAGMQQILAFPREEVETPEQLAKPFEPALRLVYTPDFRPDDMPGKQAIVVDLEGYRTYVMGPDYFGESKKGALRMLAALVYRQGGLLMHSGAKAVYRGGDAQTMAILGLSGTGKTTTTFSKQGDAIEPIQDDMIAIWPGGEISITENGCFAKTYGLSEKTEPVIYHGTLDRRAWLENVYIDENGRPDFAKGILTPREVQRLRDVLIRCGAPAHNVDRYIAGEVPLDEIVVDDIPRDGWDFVAWTENGRSIIPMSAIENAADLHRVPHLRLLGILNRDEGHDAATPGIVRFTDPQQAAAYYMLGETSMTSASGKDRGKIRSPFTQPFFPLSHSLQAKRFSELAPTFPETTMWMMNTGFIGGDSNGVRSGDAINVEIPHSSAMLEALIAGDIVWTRDPDFGYDVVDVEAPGNAALLAKVPAEILQPRRFFEARGRIDEYRKWVERMKDDRAAFLREHHVEDRIVRSIAL